MQRFVTVYIIIWAITFGLTALDLFQRMSLDYSGINEFPGSPDWIGMHLDALVWHASRVGLLFGLLLGAVGLVAATAQSPASRRLSMNKCLLMALSSLSVAILVAELMVDHIH